LYIVREWKEKGRGLSEIDEVNFWQPGGSPGYEEEEQ